MILGYGLKSEKGGGVLVDTSPKKDVCSYWPCIEHWVQKRTTAGGFSPSEVNSLSTGLTIFSSAVENCCSSK